jgi:hypothetical protein
MASEPVVWVQLATRIPKSLHRQVKLHCIQSDVSLTEFIVQALEEKMQRESGAGRRGGSRRARGGAAAE